MKDILSNSKRATAIVLAGGTGSRMGKNKAFLEINNKPFIQNITEQLDTVFDEIIIGSNDLNLYNFLGYKVVPDKVRGQGPLMGIFSALSASSNFTNFITACDIPTVNLSFISKLIMHSKNADIAVPRLNNGMLEPLFAVYNKSCLDVMETAIQSGTRKIDKIFCKLKVFYVKPEDFTWYKNINTIDDYNSYLS